MNKRFNENQSSLFTKIIGFIGIIPLGILLCIWGIGIVSTVYGIGIGVVHLSVIEIWDNLKTAILLLITGTIILILFRICIQWILGKPVDYELLYWLVGPVGLWWTEHKFSKKNQK